MINVCNGKVYGQFLSLLAVGLYESIFMYFLFRSVVIIISDDHCDNKSFAHYDIRESVRYYINETVLFGPGL